MAFTVEDGTAKSDATSFVTEDFADTYHDDRGNTDWAAGDGTAKEQALIRGTTYVELLGRNRWPGRTVRGRDQALSWPRENAFDQEGELIDETEVPVEIKHAVCEAALRELASPGSLLPDVTQSERESEVQVGPIRVKYVEGFGGAEGPVPIVTAIEKILANILAGNAAGPMFLKRA